MVWELRATVKGGQLMQFNLSGEYTCVAPLQTVAIY